MKSPKLAFFAAAATLTFAGAALAQSVTPSTTPAQQAPANQHRRGDADRAPPPRRFRRPRRPRPIPPQRARQHDDHHDDGSAQR
jgi:hypothetical protein